MYSTNRQNCEQFSLPYIARCVARSVVCVRVSVWLSVCLLVTTSPIGGSRTVFLDGGDFRNPSERTIKLQSLLTVLIGHWLVSGRYNN